MQQLGSHRTAFHEIFWPIISQKPVETRFFFGATAPVGQGLFIHEI
jgi:hypothetical protein